MLKMNIKNTCLLILLFCGWSLFLEGQSAKKVEFTYDDNGTQRTANFDISILVNGVGANPHSNRDEIKLSKKTGNKIVVSIGKVDWGGGKDYSLSFLGSSNKVLFDNQRLNRTDKTKRIGKFGGVVTFDITDQGSTFFQMNFGLEKGNVNVKNKIVSYKKEFTFIFPGEVVKNDPPPTKGETKPKEKRPTPPAPPKEPASRCMKVRNATSGGPIETYLADYPNGKCATEAKQLLASWKELNSISDPAILAQWNQNNPSSQFSDHAADRMIMISDLKSKFTKTDNQFEVELSYFIKPTISRIDGWNDQDFTIDTSNLKSDGAFSIKIDEGTEAIIHIYDSGKPSNNRLAIDLSNPLEVEVDSSKAGIYTYIFKGGGEGPYVIELKQNNRPLLIKKETTGKKISIKKSELLGQNIKGEINIVASNASSNTDELPTIYIEDSGLPIPIELLALIGVLIIGLIIFFIVKGYQRRQKEKGLEERKNFQKENTASTPPPPKTTTIENVTDTSDTEDTNESPTAPITSTNTPPPKKEGIVIKSVRKDTASEKGKGDQPIFADLIENGNFYKLDLTGLWADTSVLNVYMGKQPIRDIDLYLRSTTANEGKEQEGKIPEIGGFLMGQFEEKGMYYDIAITQFVPIEAANQNAYKLEFSTESMAVELSNVLDNHPHLKVIGWFHTHPGHGLFLSKPDLTIHEGFFLKRYQVAMEIDSLSENLDTAFFTRSVNGTINNVEDLNPGIDWFHWTEIEKSTRRRR